MSWLIGILHDVKEDNPILYGEKIDDVLQDLLPIEKQKAKQYIN
jgi:hypothetical protein